MKQKFFSVLILASAFFGSSYSFANSVLLKDLPAGVPAVKLFFQRETSSKVTQAIDYEDCVESTLFRLLFAFFRANPGSIQLAKPELKAFFERHQIQNHLNSDVFVGESWFTVRATWADFLADRPGFVYATAGKGEQKTHELKATWPNIRQFFLTFFQEIPGFNLDSSPEKIADICRTFGPDFSCLANPETVKENNLDDETRILPILISYQNAAYLRWEIEQKFRKSDRARMGGDTRLVDLR